MGNYRKRPWRKFMTPAILERFLSYVKPGPRGKCWVWQGGHDTCEYGKFRPTPDEDGFTPQRFMFAIVHGGEEANRHQCIRHTCDNPPCVNPAHLLGGTHQENRMDAIHRGRAHTFKRGSRHSGARLNEEQVARIKRRLRGGEMGKDLAPEFNISEAAISSLRTGKTWTHVK